MRDPEQTRYSQNTVTTVRVKQTAALQTQLGRGGMLNRDFSRASGFKVQNAYANQIGMGATIHVNRNQNHIVQYIKDKRPVSSHHTLFKQNQSGYIRRKAKKVNESNATGLSFCDTIKIE